MDNDKQHGHGKHILLMLLGCLIPIGIIIGLRYFNIGGPILSKLPFFLMLFLCPLMHIFMMKGMMGHGKNSCHEESDNNGKIKGSNK